MSPTVFSFDGTAVRTFADDKGDPWFCAKDVCTVLGYRNDSDAVQKHCREAGVAKRDLSSGGQMRELSFINEGNLYRLIIKSRKSEAARFESWVCDEVLPAIRKSGHYAYPAAQAEATTASVPVAEYVGLLKASAELARRKATDTLADVAVSLIGQGHASRAEIIAATGLQAQYVDYLLALHRPAPAQVPPRGVRMIVGQNHATILD